MGNDYENIIKRLKEIPVEKQLQKAYEEGYRYVVQDTAMYALCFSLKSKKFLKLEIWGYKDGEMDLETALAAKIIWGQVEGVEWSNRYPTEINSLLK
ncbi:hypothetical protein RAK27_05350 [Carnobacterium maltaromaticum]|uniref:Uncharacterized protein n=1 Tax=Carnobacterium maltaromaticum TaxID=2751 RepID=A0AAW9JS01_CARML|nr:hypothetical protein [Carnobacterium maltaromaticum]MDZ5758079.1 hypothetical protein [Carnobacterium maltaromaticum]